MKVKVISLPYIFQVLYVLCFTRPRYQVSVCRTIGPLVSYFDEIDVSKQNSPNGMPHFVASHPGLFCLPLSHEKDARLVWVDKSSV